MTKNESFKRRVRDRMAKTGERYSAARAALIDQVPEVRRRTWVSEPEVTDEVIIERTSRGWDDWCDLIEAWPGHVDGHSAIAAHIEAQHGLDGWWSQCVTVGYERIVGLRLPHQRADGTFTAGKSMTVAVDAAHLRSMLLDDDDRADLFGGTQTQLRSKPASKSIRIEIGPGSALLGLTPTDDGRTKVTIAHERLPSPDDVPEWKFFWGDWLEALDNS